MSDTPRTDDARFGTGLVTADFARQLERENTKLLALSCELAVEKGQLERELAEAREDAANQRRLADLALAHRDVILAERDTLAGAAVIAFHNCK